MYEATSDYKRLRRETNRYWKKVYKTKSWKRFKRTGMIGKHSYLNTRSAFD